MKKDDLAKRIARQLLHDAGKYEELAAQMRADGQESFAESLDDVAKELRRTGSFHMRLIESGRREIP
ncbi:hypothetical protein EHS39_13395 [Ensifer sp. MPMI2T]|nr:hypothetical protein EHS39_13395 [Ensifer sp. MPMI2T]